MSVAVTRAAAATATGVQRFNAPAGFGVPTGALVFVTTGIANSVEANEAVLSIGFTDGTRQGIASAIFSDDIGGGGTSTRTYDRSNATQLVNAINTNNGDKAIGVFSAFGDSYLDINWTTAPIGAFLVTIWWFGGSANVRTGTAAGNAGNLTGFGFNPNLVIAATTSAAGGGTSNGSIGFGFAVSGAEGGVAMSGRHAIGTSKDDLLLDTDDGATQLFNDGIGGQSNISLITDGISLAGDGIEVQYLAVDLGGPAVWLSNQVGPTATGTDTITGMTFTPGFVAFAMIAGTTANSVLTTAAANASSIGIGLADGTREFSLAIRHQDGVSTHSHGSISDARAIHVNDEAGTADSVATLTSFAADTITLDYVTATDAVQMMVLAIEEEGGAAPVTATAAGRGGGRGAATAVRAQPGTAEGRSGGRGAATGVDVQTGTAAGRSGGRGAATAVQAQPGTAAGRAGGRGAAVGVRAVPSATAGRSGGRGDATAVRAVPSGAASRSGGRGAATGIQVQTGTAAGRGGGHGFSTEQPITTATAVGRSGGRGAATAVHAQLGTAAGRGGGRGFAAELPIVTGTAAGRGGSRGQISGQKTVPAMADGRSGGRGEAGSLQTATATTAGRGGGHGVATENPITLATAAGRGGARGQAGSLAVGTATGVARGGSRGATAALQLATGAAAGRGGGFGNASEIPIVVVEQIDVTDARAFPLIEAQSSRVLKIEVTE